LEHAWQSRMACGGSEKKTNPHWGGGGQKKKKGTMMKVSKKHPSLIASAVARNGGEMKKLKVKNRRDLCSRRGNSMTTKRDSTIRAFRVKRSSRERNSLQQPKERRLRLSHGTVSRKKGGTVKGKKKRRYGLKGGGSTLGRTHSAHVPKNCFSMVRDTKKGKKCETWRKKGRRGIAKGGEKTKPKQEKGKVKIKNLMVGHAWGKTAS